MSWDKNKPAGSDLVPDVDDEIRTNNDALETALNLEHDFSTGGGQTGKHKFPVGTTANRPAASIAGRIYLNTETNSIERDTGSDWVTAAEVNVSEFPSGTQMVFYQDTAPTGWTIQDTLDDKLLMVTKGSAAGGRTGGTSSGSWTITGGSVTVAGHTLTIAEMPSHTHSYSWEGHSFASYSGSATYGGTHQTGATGGNQPHSHGATFSHDGSWRPAAYNVIIAKKEGLNGTYVYPQ